MKSCFFLALKKVRYRLKDPEVPAHLREKQKRKALDSIASLIFDAEEAEAPSERDETQMDDEEDRLM